MTHKTLTYLLTAALALSAGHLAANGDTSSNKTFLMPRPLGVNASMQSTTFEDMVHHKAHHKLGFNLAATGFWQQSENSKEQSKYFLADRKATIDVSRADLAAPSYLSASSVDAGLLVHEANLGGDDTPGSTTLSLSPEQKVYGAVFNLFEDLHKWGQIFYVSVNVPVVHVEHHTRLNVASTNAILKDRLTTFFRGGDASGATLPADKQAPLQKGKIGKHVKAGVADVDVVLGYKLEEKVKRNASFGIALTIPSGNKPTGEWLFEPMVGNGRHWGLGFNLDSGMRLWRNEKSRIHGQLSIKFRYLFEGDERRMLNFTGNTQVYQMNLSQYQLLQKHGAAAGTAYVPAANISTLPVDVTPGSQLDADLCFSYHRGGLSASLGYNVYEREAESISLKGSPLPAGYAIVSRGFNNGAQFDAANPAHVETGVAGLATNLLTNANLYLPSAATGAQFTNAIYGGVGYRFGGLFPVITGIGAKYEFANTNNALEQWAAWLKVGIGF